MTKYEIIFEKLQNQVDSGELTMEDAEVLNQLAFEKYGDDDTEYEEAIVEEAYDEESIAEAADLVAEGVLSIEDACEYFEITEKTGNNEVLKKTIKNNSTIINDQLSDIRTMIREKKYDKAKGKIARTKTALKIMETHIKNIKTDMEDDLISVCLDFGIEAAEAVVVACTTAMEHMDSDAENDISKINNKSVAKQAAQIMGIRLGVSTVTKTIDTLQKIHSGENFNVYKRKALDAINDAFRACDRLENKIERKKKFDAFMKKNKNNILKGAAIAAGTTAVVGGSVFAAKKILKKKDTKDDEPADKLHQ